MKRTHGGLRTAPRQHTRKTVFRTCDETPESALLGAARLAGAGSRLLTEFPWVWSAVTLYVIAMVL